MMLILAIVALPPLAMLMINMNVAVTSSEIVIRYFPVRRRIRFSEIASFTPIPYDWASFGGWGIKWQPGRGRMVYSVSGDRAVELTLTSGKRIVIGTQRPDELATALETAGIQRAGE